MKAVNLLEPAHEHEFEAQHGLPQALPRGETLLWQGSPDPWLLAVQALHLRKVALYFTLLLAWRLASERHDGADWTAALLGCAGMLLPIALGLGLIAGMAWLIARTTVYTLTDARVVMRIGVVLSITFNLPLRRIAAAQRHQRRGSADIALALAGDDRIAYPHLWPHARPWRLRRPEPMLRALPTAQAATLAALLAQALQAAHARAAAVPRAGQEAGREAVHEPGHESGQALPRRPSRDTAAGPRLHLPA